MIKKKRKKNPFTPKEILGNIKYENIYYNEETEICEFELKSNKIIDDIRLTPNKYILKIYKKFPIQNIEVFKQLSKYELIPKIYVINTHYLIYKYVEGQSLIGFIYDVKNKLSITDKNKILNKINILIKKWHTYGYFHGDLNHGNNIIIDPFSLNVIFIDPIIDFYNLSELNANQINHFFRKDNNVVLEIENMFFNKYEDED